MFGGCGVKRARIATSEYRARAYWNRIPKIWIKCKRNAINLSKNKNCGNFILFSNSQQRTNCSLQFGTCLLFTHFRPSANKVLKSVVSVTISPTIRYKNPGTWVSIYSVHCGEYCANITTRTRTSTHICKYNELVYMCGRNDREGAWACDAHCRRKPCLTSIIERSANRKIPALFRGRTGWEGRGALPLAERVKPEPIHPARYRGVTTPTCPACVLIYLHPPPPSPLNPFRSYIDRLSVYLLSASLLLLLLL